MNNFSIKERRVGGVTVLDIRGKLIGCGGRGILRDAIGHPLEEGCNQILLNLAQVSDIDSSCLGELVSSHLYLRKMGGRMKIAHPSQHLRELMTITNLQTVYDIYDTEWEALDSFMKETLDPEKQTPGLAAAIRSFYKGT
jgi:anti-sigma B factor antagonist